MRGGIYLLENRFFQLLCGAKLRCRLCRNVYLLSGLRVDTFPRGALHDFEYAESRDFHLIALDHCALNRIEEHINELERVLLGAVHLVHHKFSKAFFIHTPLSFGAAVPISPEMQNAVEELGSIRAQKPYIRFLIITLLRLDTQIASIYERKALPILAEAHFTGKLLRQRLINNLSHAPDGHRSP